MNVQSPVDQLRVALSMPRSKVTLAEISQAVSVLERSHKGQAAIRALSAWLDDEGCGLDTYGQAAVKTILEGVWGSYAGTTRDLLRESLAPVGPDSVRATDLLG